MKEDKQRISGIKADKQRSRRQVEGEKMNRIVEDKQRMSTRHIGRMN
jgi:hypothetical protein